tara:strand:+ start:791 stop:1033 length:243 start_codon:yes stop_codon:yes gene_type:complete
MNSFFAIATLALTSTPALAQHSYYPPSYYGAGSSSPVVVPPTIINNQPRYMENESKKSCNESEIDLFLFAIRKTQGDCTQ